MIRYELLESYKLADYHVDATPSFILKIGMYSAELESIFKTSRKYTAAFITAFNPYSQERIQSPPPFINAGAPAVQPQPSPPFILFAQPNIFHMDRFLERLFRDFLLEKNFFLFLFVFFLFNFIYIINRFFIIYSKYIFIISWTIT